MASLQECERALHCLAERLEAVDPALRRKHAVDRTVSCRVTDLDAVLHATVADGAVTDLRCIEGSEDGSSAQIRLATSSDDLLALLAGRLPAPVAWATGRLTVEASVLDLLRLRALL